MSNNYIIEVGSQVAGIVVWDGFGYCFYASVETFNSLEGRSFCTPFDAERAAVRQSSARSAKPT